MRRQEFVDKSVRYIRRNGKSMFRGSCRYQGTGRKKCAIGVHFNLKNSPSARLLIENERGEKYLITKIEDDHVQDALRESGVSRIDKKFFMAFQSSVHDAAAHDALLSGKWGVPFKTGFERRLLTFCSKYNLKVTV